MSKISTRIWRFFRTGKSLYHPKAFKLEVFRQQMTIELETQRTLLAICLAGIGYNMFLLTGDTYHSRLIHITSGIAILALFLTSLNIFHGLKIVTPHMAELIDEEIINNEKDPKFAEAAKLMPRIIYRVFITGFFFTLLSLIQIGFATMPENWH